MTASPHLRLLAGPGSRNPGQPGAFAQDVAAAAVVRPPLGTLLSIDVLCDGERGPA